jgi:thioredoxin-like negative regulator of GroEL
VDLAVETAKHFRIREIPTVLFFRDGVVVAYLIGIFRKKDIVAKLQAVVGRALNSAGETADQP